MMRVVPLLAAVCGAAAAAGCDAPYQQFLDAIPTEEIDPAVPASVYLGIDGLSRQAFDQARARGAFAGYAAADLITVFPGTSDYAWTRTMRAGSMGGYEMQYFDSARNELTNGGLTGIAEHPLREGIAGTFPCYERFDFLGDGETWQLDSYLDPAAALRPTLDALFDTIAARARTKSQILAYLLNVDIVSHLGGMEQAVAMLVELDRRIRDFQDQHRRTFRFTLFADHGNAHIPSRLVDPRQILRDVGVTPVESLDVTPRSMQAVAVVHTRVSYAALHAPRAQVAEIAARTSRHPDVDLAVARLGDGGAGPARYGVWRSGVAAYFRRDAAGAVTLEDPAAWAWLRAELPGTLTDREAFDATRDGPYPDLFYRVATAFTHPAAQFPADILLSMPDDVASAGETVLGAGEIRAVAGFHGSLTRAATLSVVASQAFIPPAAVRADELADLIPALAGK
jgi:hypothetical protein